MAQGKQKSGGGGVAWHGGDCRHRERYHLCYYQFKRDDHVVEVFSGGAAIGSGLNTISNYDWVDFTRVKWDTCSDASESDCLTPKGFTFMRWNPSEGVYIDFYNLHADAG